ncbi:MAG TPA: LruC domain-containing protein [Anaerolineaceae bacterium]|nr:LruC domain-containing protein [Anaerolineaceae bacterium]
MKNTKLTWFRALALLLITLIWGCTRDNEANLKLADDVIPLEKLPAQINLGPMPGGTTIKCYKKTTCLIASNQIENGHVTMANDEAGNIYVEFTVYDSWTIEAIYFFLGDQFRQIPRSVAGNAMVQEFPYKYDLKESKEKTHTLKLEVGKREACYVASAYVEVIDNNNNRRGLWAGCVGNSSSADAFYINQNINNGLYVGYCYSGCDAIDFTFAFEDQKGDGNDMDYNDLVIQAKMSEIYQADNEVKTINMIFYAKARGAGHDHEFKISIPIQGASNVQIKRYNALGEILNTEQFSRNGNLMLNIFNSTKDAMRNKSNTDTVRTLEGLPPCLAASWSVDVKIEVANPSANLSGVGLVKPYDPFIVIKQSPSVPVPYELHIFEITGTDTFQYNGLTYPNGLIVPDNWGWPLSGVNIRDVYPDFPAPKWHETFAENPGGYFKAELFGPPCE